MSQVRASADSPSPCRAVSSAGAAPWRSIDRLRGLLVVSAVWSHSSSSRGALLPGRADTNHNAVGDRRKGCFVCQFGCWCDAADSLERVQTWSGTGFLTVPSGVDPVEPPKTHHSGSMTVGRQHFSTRVASLLSGRLDQRPSDFGYSVFTRSLIETSAQ